MRKTITANGVPKLRGKLVTKMKIGPLLLRVCSFAASDADVDDAGYWLNIRIRTVIEH